MDRFIYEYPQMAAWNQNEEGVPSKKILVKKSLQVRISGNELFFGFKMAFFFWAPWPYARFSIGRTPALLSTYSVCADSTVV